MKKLILALFVSLAIFNCGSAFADSISAAVTGDDNISYWDANKQAWQALGTSWLTPDFGTLNINTSSYEVYFAVSNNNWYPGGNPAGFLASFTDTTPGSIFVQTGTNTLVSSPSTVLVKGSRHPFNQYLPGPGVPLSKINPHRNPTTIKGWHTPTSYGSNSGNGSIWASVNGGPVDGINPDAQWLWTSHNDGTYATQTDYAYFEINLGVVPTPEAPTLLLFALAGGLVLLLMRKNMLKVA